MRRAPLLATALLALTLAGCSAPADTGSTTEETSTEASAAPSVAPATGEAITGDGFTVNIPDGWGSPSGAALSSAGTIYVVDLEDPSEMPANLTVIPSPAGELTPEQIEEAATPELEAVGATEIQILDRVTVAGKEAAHINAALALGETGFQMHQFALANAGATQLVSFTFSEDMSEADRAAVYEPVLASWQWS